MIACRHRLTEEQAVALEELLPETGSLHWSLHRDLLRGEVVLQGYFSDQAEAEEEWSELRNHVSWLPGEVIFTKVEERDWREAYKEFFQPWSLSGLHWIPEWLRTSHPVPEGAAVIYLDPGMAFGTGNHETTRLCAARILEAAEQWGDACGEKVVVDAGCGSGILALSAAALGFGVVRGFDNDPEAVRVARENAASNHLNQIRFRHGDLSSELHPNSVDLLVVNIFADVLRNHADILLKAMRPRGILVLSGILRQEGALTDNHFQHTAARLRISWDSDLHEDGEWVDIRAKVRTSEG